MDLYSKRTDTRYQIIKTRGYDYVIRSCRGDSEMVIPRGLVPSSQWCLWSTWVEEKREGYSAMLDKTATPEDKDAALVVFDENHR